MNEEPEIKKVPVKIDKKIVSYLVKTKEQSRKEKEEGISEEGLKSLENVSTKQRPDMLLGSTYKVKTPLEEHALYLTINDMILNEGTEYEERRPYEIFINSKNMEHYQWVVALTRVISAIFRKGGDIAFLAEELKGIFDPKGGYFEKGGLYVPSLVARIGMSLENHLRGLNLITRGLSIAEEKALAKKKEEAVSKGVELRLCPKCNSKGLVMLDGCLTCIQCGDSKCS